MNNISYVEPVQGLDEFGEDVVCTRQVRVTEEDAIKIQRRTTRRLLHERGSLYSVLHIGATRLLQEYMLIHWAERD